MKKLLIILFIGFTSLLQAQTYTNEDVCQIQFNLYVNNQVIDSTYYFEMHNDKLDIHFVNTSNNNFNCFLEYGEEYKFIFKYKNSKKKSVIVKTSPQINRKKYIVNLEYEPTIH